MSEIQIRKWRSGCVSLGLLALTAAAGCLGAVAQEATEPFNNRLADAQVLLSQSKLYTGGYGMAGKARICGVVPADQNFAGVPAFGVHLYPDPPPPRGSGEVTDVTFDSKELIGNVTSTGAFKLSVTVQSTKVGSPPAFVVDTSRTSGLATLTRPKRGEIRLTVEGRTDDGVTVHLVLNCGHAAPD